MTNGFGAMPDYRAQISPRDRWAIAAYVRALQLSQHASAADTPGRGAAEALAAPAAARRGREHKQWMTTRLSRPSTRPGSRSLQRRGMIVGVAGAVIGGLGVVLHPDQFMPSWLIGFLFVFGLSLGCLALLMLQHMTGGQWGLVSRRIFEAGSAAAAAVRRCCSSRSRRSRRSCFSGRGPKPCGRTRSCS